MAFPRLCLLKFNLQEPWVTAESISLQVQALPYTTLSYIPSLLTLCQTSTLTFLKYCMLQVSPSCASASVHAWVLSHFPGVTNIPAYTQPCSGTSAPHRPCLRGCLALLEGGGVPAWGQPVPSSLLKSCVPAGKHQMDGGPVCLHPHHLLPFSSLPAQRKQLQGTVQSIWLRCPE